MVDFRELNKNHGTKLKIGALLLWILVVAVMGSINRVFFFVLGLTPALLFPFYYIWLRVFYPFLQVNTTHVATEGNESKDMESNNGNDKEDVLRTCPCCTSTGRAHPFATRKTCFLLIFWGFVLLSVMPSLLRGSVGEEPSIFFILGYNLFGSFLLLIVALLFMEMVVVVIMMVRMVKNKNKKKISSNASAVEIPFTRSVKEDRAISVVSLILWVVLSTIAIGNGYSEAAIVRIDIPMDIPACLDKYQIALITDLHSGPMVGKKEVRRIVKQANALDVDVFVLGGDFSDGSVEDLGVVNMELQNLEAPDGAYFVTGNHDYLHGADLMMWSNFFTDIGIKVLNSTHDTLPKDDSRFGCSLKDNAKAHFYILGLEDYSKKIDDLDGAMEGIPEDKSAVLIAHQPAHAPAAAKYKNIKLQLSGHVHGGQIWPLHGLTYAVSAHFSGLEKEDHMWVYTSEGVIGWGPRVRFMSFNEITVVTLRSKEVSNNIDDEASLSYKSAIAAIPFLALTFICCIGSCSRKLVIKKDF